MIQAQPSETKSCLAERDALISGSIDYVASVLEVPSPEHKSGPYASAILADVVSDLNKGDRDAALASFQEIDRHPIDPNTLCVNWSSDTVSDEVWAKVRNLFDTDKAVNFAPAPASYKNKTSFQESYGKVRQKLEKYCPEALVEFDAIVSVILLAEPKTDTFYFDGASTFFCPGAILINSKPTRNLAQTLEVVLHEASHLLLFAWAGSDGLSSNDPTKGYSSPLRDEPRPMEGIFHASFVTSRVHWVISEILRYQDLEPSFRKDLTAEHNRLGSAARDSLDILNTHCQPTDKGRVVLDQLNAYWA